MQLINMIFALGLATSAAASPAAESKRAESTKWMSRCTQSAAPADFKAFDLGACAAQLSFSKDRYIGVQWAFEATFADGSRAEYKPYNRTSLGVSHTYYPNEGNNFLTKKPGNSAFTAVHEFTDVCKDGKAPVSWRFFTTSAIEACTPIDYRYTSGQVPSVGGVTRPAKVSGLKLSRVEDGEFKVEWLPVVGAAAYSVIVQYPTGLDDIDNPYMNVRGERVKGTTATVDTTTFSPDVKRNCVVHAVDSKGLWSFTNDVEPISAGW